MTSRDASQGHLARTVHIGCDVTIRRANALLMMLMVTCPCWPVSLSRARRSVKERCDVNQVHGQGRIGRPCQKNTVPDLRRIQQIYMAAYVMKR